MLIEKASGTLRKIEIFTKNHRDREINFEWPTPLDLTRLDCDLDTFKLKSIIYQPHSCGFSAL